jgi:hypothetical protein
MDPFSEKPWNMVRNSWWNRCVSTKRWWNMMDNDEKMMANDGN